MNEGKHQLTPEDIQSREQLKKLMQKKFTNIWGLSEGEPGPGTRLYFVDTSSLSDGDPGICYWTGETEDGEMTSCKIITDSAQSMPYKSETHFVIMNDHVITSEDMPKVRKIVEDMNSGRGWKHDETVKTLMG